MAQAAQIAASPTAAPTPAGRPEIAPRHRPDAAPLAGARLRGALGRDWALGWLLIMPVALILLALLAYPFVDALLMSFQQRFIGKTGVWIGIANYQNFLTNPNTHFVKAAINVLLMTGFAILGKLLIGLAMASVLNQPLPLRNVWRSVMFLPWAVPVVVSAYVWRFLFDTTGPINGAIAHFHLRSDYLLFFGDPTLALPAIIVVVIWSGTPFWTMNILAGMQAISPEQYEAAEIDGAGTLQRFRYVTLPGLQSVLLVTGLLSTIWTSANITLIFVLTGGGPNYGTVTPPMLAYLVSIPGKQLGAGAAISMMMVPGYVVLLYFLTRRMLKQEE